jgi:cellulose synthase (UDP-forming)
MWSDTYTVAELVAPTLLVFGALYVGGSILPMARPWARVCIVVFVGVVLLRYVTWRVVDTVLPADGAWYEIAWIWLCLAIELLALFDASILYLTFLRRSDRTAEADRHERRLRALPSDALPSVDVFVPTYNEPIEILEKTITGALCLDYANVMLWVLDDGRRPWLRDYCEAKGVGYLTRPNNAHGKAGNVNHALQMTTGEFVAIFDADFVPNSNFLMRTIGFFEDARVGIVQAPHAFYNLDPMQANLALRKALPHDQSFFFESIMPSRDAWDVAFCCGSNSVTRRAAIDAAGGGLPTDSITEDILLTLTLLRRGYITRYLNERLAYGLAPESLDAFFIQRERWARGGIQTLYLAAGPFGRGLSFMQRLMFLPVHWLSQSPALMLAAIAPVVFLWTGILPFVNVTAEAELYYFLPTILSVVGGIWLFAPAHFSPLAAYVLGTFQSFRLLPHVLQTLVRPFGHAFKVTPKGHHAAGRAYQAGVFWPAAILLALTLGGLLVNTIPEYQIVKTSGSLVTVAILGAVNILVLFLVCMLSLQTTPRRTETRFELDEPVSIFNVAGALLAGRIKNLSMSGAAIVIEGARAAPAPGERIRIFIDEVGFIAGDVVRRERNAFALEFHLPQSIERDLLIRKLFTQGRDAVAVSASVWRSTAALVNAIWSHRRAALQDVADVPNERAPHSLPAGVAKLPARSLLISPRADPIHLADLGARRRRPAA